MRKRLLPAALLLAAAPCSLRCAGALEGRLVDRLPVHRIQGQSLPLDGQSLLAREQGRLAKHGPRPQVILACQAEIEVGLAGFVLLALIGPRLSRTGAAVVGVGIGASWYPVRPDFGQEWDFRAVASIVMP